MSRLASKEKLLYYRTPEPIVEAIARYLTLRDYGFARLLDPCAGTGKALSLLTGRLKEHHLAQRPPYYRQESLTLETYGIEPELLRAREAMRCLDHTLQASFFSTTLSNGEGADGGWQLVFLNPPYDTDTEISARGRKTRLEVNFLYRATHKLCPAGILIWIVPQSSLKPAAPFLASRYERLACVRFPDDLWQPDPDKQEKVSLYGQFHQIVLFGQKRAYDIPPRPETVQVIEGWANAGAELPVLPLEGRATGVPIYTIPNARSRELSRFSSGSFAPDETARRVAQISPKTLRYQTGVWASSDYLAARLPDAKAVGFGIGTPMAPLKNAHLAVLSVAGIANRAVLVGKDGRRVIVKGYSRKVPIYSCYEDEEEIVEKVTDTFETALWCIDLDTGGLIRVETGKATQATFPVAFESMSLPAFLDTFGVSLTRQVAQANPPRYEGEAYLPWVAKGWQLLNRKPLGKQREIILANVYAYLRTASAAGEEQTLNRIAPVAEMATGKTFISLCSAFLADRYACGGVFSALPGTRLRHIFPLVVLCPPIMARKWKREAEMTLPNVRAVIVKRMGMPAVGERQAAEDEDEGEHEPGGDDLADFRRFDPTFTGISLSSVGCMDRVVARIRRELAAWKHAYDAALHKGEEPPLKPCHIVIISTSTAKLGKEWMPLYRLKPARYIDPRTGKVRLRRDDTGKPYTVPCCPSCFRAIKDERRMAQLAKASAEFRGLLAHAQKQQAKQRLAAFEAEALEPPQIYLTEQDLLGTKDHRVKRTCSECGEALWQYVPIRDPDWQPYSVLRPKKGPLKPLPLPDHGHLPPCITSTFRRRYPLSDYILRRYKGFFHLLIADEMHEGADGTALDFARQRLASACGRMMGLTGTLSNGYSASLFRLYYLLNRSVRCDFGYDEVERWIDLYGKRQTTRKTYKEQEIGHGATSDRRTGKPMTREIAGFAPQGLARVLPCSAFLELADVAPGLPHYHEEIRAVEMGNVLGPAYDTFERKATQEIGRMLASGDKSGLSAWWNGLMNYPNLPFLGWTCMIKKTQEIFATAPALPEDIVYPKERAIIDYVQQEYDAGRRVLIYTENTGYYDIMPRLKKLLETKVRGRHHKPITVALLRSTTVETINREAWLDKQVAAGCDVLICNPKLVKVGLDLIAFPTIIYASLPKSTADLRQSSRRSLRLGQTKPVKVVFFIYPAMEMRLLRLMSEKMKASLMVEGQLPGEGLVSFGEEEAEDESDMYVQLAREVLANLEAGTRPTIEQAQELQDQFNENERLARAKNQTLGQEGNIEPVAFDPIRVEPLSTSASFSDEPEVIGTPADEKPREVKAGAPATETVTIIHTAVTSGKDPWAALRIQYLKPRKPRKKKPGYPEGVLSLWEIAESSANTPATSPQASSEEPAPAVLTQNTLW